MQALKTLENGNIVYKLANKPIGGGNVYYASRHSKKVQYFNENTTGYSVSGSITIADGIASGFSSNKWVYISNVFAPGSKPWKSVTKVRFFSFTNNNTIISYQYSGHASFQVATKNGANAGKLVIYLSSDGSAKDIANNLMTSTAVVSTNTWYWVALVFTGTKYEVRLSADKETWTTVITVNSSTPIYQNTQNSYGYNFSTYPEPLDGEIDLKETYIEYDDKIWFRGDFPEGVFTN